MITFPAQWRTLLSARFTLVDCRERLLSAAGGFVGILCVLLVSGQLLDTHGAAWVVASMGASSVLLFAVPHGQLSQPWPVFGGQVLSALVGVACARYIDPPMLAAATAVGGAIFVMYHLRCIHPPGGATALAAVLGGDKVHALGWHFVVTPVAANAGILLAVAVAVNWPFTWRRYPLMLPRPEPEGGTLQVEPSDLEWALRRINSFIDVSERDLQRILDLATRHARARSVATDETVAGGYYSNGRFGPEWQVRKVLYAEPGPGGAVRYRVAAGVGRGARGQCSRDDFTRWARHRVVRDESSWRRLAQEEG